MKDKKVLVTGGTGLVGSYLLRYLLQKGYPVKAIKRATSPMDLVADIQHQIEWVEGDILDVPFLEKIMKDVHQVYHAAAVISFDPSQVSWMMQVNKEGTANIVNAALYRNIEKLIHVSSIAALGRKEYQPNIDESAQWENSKENSNYAISKFKAEAEVWRGIQEGLSAAIINPSVILGAGYWDSGSCKIFDRVARGLNHYPTGTTGFVDVRDVALAAIALMESDIEAERYIVNAANWSYKRLLTHLAKALQKKSPTKAAPKWIVDFMAKAEWVRSKLLNTSPLLTKETIRNLQSTYQYNNQKIQKELGFKFRPLEQTIVESANIYTKSKAKKQTSGVLPLA